MAGIISHLQRFSLHDGPGVRTTVFFKGCPLRCFWCHNPETQDIRPSLAYHQDKCIHCRSCANICENGALGTSPGGKLVYDRDKCARCFRCAEICPPKSLYLNGTVIDAQSLMAELTSDMSIYAKTGGGVTFSGGEPTMQREFLREMLGLCRDNRINTAIDTCGLCNEDDFLDVCEKADMVLFDLKHMDGETHRRLTGSSNELILQNLRLLDGLGVKLQIRMPVIPGHNDDPRNINAVPGLISTLNNVQSVMLLGYHKLGLGKVYDFDRRQEDNGVQAPPRERLRALCAQIQTQLPDIPVSYR